MGAAHPRCSTARARTDTDPEPAAQRRRTPEPRSGTLTTPSIYDLLRALVKRGASDLHIKAGSPPGFRVDGHIEPQQQFGVLDSAATAWLADELMSEDQRERFERDLDLDFSVEVADVARFRINVLTQRGAVGLVARVIPATVPNAIELGLPQICLDLALKPRGLVLVTGPTGSGKSTTLAAMIDHINRNERGHILTMEDPLEFVHQDKGCFVTQRNIGHDCHSFREALRRALRQDPDVILIGEMRDLETISMAITAAETGHLVFATLHTTSAISTVDRIIDVFPTDQQQQVRVQLATTLQGVISQCLVKRTNGGRAVAQEILIATDGVRSLIREGKTAQILNLLQTGKGHGMQSLEAALIELVKQGQIRPEDAIAKANRPDEVTRSVGGLCAASPITALGETRATPEPPSRLRNATARADATPPAPGPTGSRTSRLDLRRRS
ncbi:MAG: type IV pilus twitching motility protein PilT [Planctomycetes bacterium]|nr:type IV pilus twitching motility protein PilT [Planctomycetota bacterium]